MGWHRDGTQFMSAHADGSHIVWSTLDPTKPKEQATTPYGKVFTVTTWPPLHTQNNVNKVYKEKNKFHLHI